MASSRRQLRNSYIHCFRRLRIRAGGALLAGQNGGAGFSGPWQPGAFNASNTTNYAVAGGSLTFPGLATSGNSVTTGPLQAIGGLVRPFATPLGANGTTAYVSFLVRPDGTLNGGVFNGFFGLYLDGTAAPSGNDLFIGKPGSGALGQYVLETRGGTGQVPSGGPAAVGNTTLLVVKAEFLAGNDRFTLYVNPTPGGPEPAAGAVKTDLDLGTVTGLSIYSTGAFSIDEVRVGTTFADVTPLAVVATPAPSSLALLGLGTAALAGWRREGGRGRRRPARVSAL